MAAAILDPFYQRIELRRGLSRNMNGKLRSYPVMLDMIRATIELLMEREEQAGLTGSVKMTRQEMYRLLVETRGEILMADASESLRRERYPYHVFNEAMTVAKRVGLIEGWGRCGLSASLLERFRQLAAGEEPRAAS